MDEWQPSVKGRRKTVLSLSFTATGMCQEPLPANLRLPKTGLLPIKSCSKLLRNTRKVWISPLAQSLPIILCICHCHLRPWFAVFSYLWVTSHRQKKRRERVNWSRGKVPQKRRKKAHRYTIPSSFHLQRERKFWLDLENMKTSETPLWKQVAG